MKNKIIFLVSLLATFSCMKENTKNKEFEKADEKLVDLMFFGLDYGIDNIKPNNSGSLIPIVVTEKEGKRDLKRFVTERIEDGLEKGEHYLKNENEAQYGVVIYDGYLTVDGKKVDAVLVKGFDREDEVGYIIGQRYSRKKDNSELELIGNPAFVGNEMQLLK